MSIKINTIGNQIYLGTLKFDDASVTLEKGMPVAGPDVTKQDLANYIMHENAGTLEKDIVIRGNVAFSERDLSDDLVDELNILNAKFNKAKKNAIPNLVNQTFSRLL